MSAGARPPRRSVAGQSTIASPPAAASAAVQIAALKIVALSLETRPDLDPVSTMRDAKARIANMDADALAVVILTEGDPLEMGRA